MKSWQMKCHSFVGNLNFFGDHLTIPNKYENFLCILLSWYKKKCSDHAENLRDSISNSINENRVFCENEKRRKNWLTLTKKKKKKVEEYLFWSLLQLSIWSEPDPILDGVGSYRIARECRTPQSSKRPDEQCLDSTVQIIQRWSLKIIWDILGSTCCCSRHCFLHQRMNTNGSDTKWFIFLEQ
jgi:hypothetical protein